MALPLEGCPLPLPGNSRLPPGPEPHFPRRREQATSLAATEFADDSAVECRFPPFGGGELGYRAPHNEALR